MIFVIQSQLARISDQKIENKSAKKKKTKLKKGKSQSYDVQYLK